MPEEEPPPPVNMRNELRKLIFWFTIGFMAYALGYIMVRELLLPLPIEHLVLFVL